MNLCTNPGFELDTSTWAGKSGGTIKRVMSESFGGSASLQVDTSSLDGAEGVRGGAYAADELTQYDFSAWVKAPTGADLRLRLVEDDGSEDSTQKFFTGNDDWQLVSLSHTTTAGVTGVLLDVVTDGPQTLTYYVDEVAVVGEGQLQQKIGGSIEVKTVKAVLDEAVTPGTCLVSCISIDKSAGDEPHVGPAPVFVQSSTAGNGNGSTLTIAKPAEAVAGDFLLLEVYLELIGQPISVSGGWEPLGEQIESTGGLDFRVAYFYKVDDGSAGPYSITWDGSWHWRSASILAYRGVDPDNPINAFKAAVSPEERTAMRGPSVTTTVDCCRLVMLGSNDLGTTATPPAGMTERVEFDAVYAADAIQDTAGATGDKDATLAASCFSAGALVALAPAWTLVQPRDTGLTSATVAMAYRIADGTSADECVWTWEEARTASWWIGEYTFEGTPLAPVIDTDYVVGEATRSEIALGPLVADGDGFAIAMIGRDTGANFTWEGGFTEVADFTTDGNTGLGVAHLLTVEDAAEVATTVKAGSSDQQAGILVTFGFKAEEEAQPRRTLTLLGAGR